MHPQMLFGIADIQRREELEQATRRRQTQRFVSSRVPARTRSHVPHRPSA
jgi:hypothetical protein